MNSLQAALSERSLIINVSLTCSLDYALITVKDNCSGIKEQDLDSIFDCFFTTKTEDQGTGLGLAIVRHIAESHGGKVSVKSTLNEGTEFSIQLPIAKDEYESETSSIHS